MSPITAERNPRPRAGLTLMETVVSCFVLALTMVALFNLFPTSMWALKQGENQILAENLAQNWLEHYRAEPFQVLYDNEGTYTLPQESGNGTVFNTTLVIDTPAANPPLRADLVKGLTVTVQWTFRTKPRQVVRQTWVSRVKP